MLDLAHIKRIFQITAGLSYTVTKIQYHSFLHSFSVFGIYKTNFTFAAVWSSQQRDHHD